MGSKKLKALAISDTHLGEETSLLSFPRGLQHLWETLAKDRDFWRPIFPDFDPDEDRVEVEELILCGDIPDSTLSSTSQISAGTHAFSMMLGSALDIKKAVYVPGNHDHTLWSNYLEKSERRQSSPPGITGPGGETIVQGGRYLDKGAEELLSIFFGYPIGWAWSEIEDRPDFEFALANPVYAREIGGRSYVFAHGTHFREELVSSAQKKFFRLVGTSQLDRLLKLDLEPSRDLDEAGSLEELEGLIASFVDSLWPGSKNNPTSRSDELWYLITLFREGPVQERNEPPPRSEIFPRKSLPGAPEARISKLTDEDGEPLDGSLERFREYFLPHLGAHLEEGGLPRDEIVFVYGDTHRGGWGELASDGGGRTRVYNCGAWVVSTTGQHPACHLFAIDDEGEEYLLDISFGENVKVGEETLLHLAAQDIEHRFGFVNLGVRAFGEALQTSREALGGALRFFRNL